MKKLPPDAFDLYFSLGPGRSYQAVAERYGVTKRAVTNLAKREDWQGRLARIEAEARERADQKKVDAREAMNERHLQSARFLQGKALAALREMPLDKPLAAVKALDVGIRQERLILGEPSERTAVSLEDTIRREYERWMTSAGEAEADDGETEAAEDAGEEDLAG
jgi:hypothetical protein